MRPNRFKNIFFFRLCRRITYVLTKNKDEKEKAYFSDSTVSISDYDTNNGNGWEVAELICIKCGDRGIHVFPHGASFRYMECGSCFREGWLIRTNEPLPEGKQ